MNMKSTLFALVCLGILMANWGCQLKPRPHLMHYMYAQPVLPEGDEVYYVDPIDSSVVWSKEGVQLKVRPLSDQTLNEEYGLEDNPYTVGHWRNEEGFTPAAGTVFQITIINRTRERVEMDFTEVVLRLDNGYHWHLSGGPWDGPFGHSDYPRSRYRMKDTGEATGPWDGGYPNSYSYKYPKYGDHDGRSGYYNVPRGQIASRASLKREKPIRKGQKHNGKISFGALPAGVKEFTLEVNNFILAYDSNEVGYGNPIEFTDMVFHFKVDHGMMVVDKVK